MKLEKDEVGTWITDRYGVKIYLDEKEAEQLKKQLDNEEMILQGIDIQAFISCAMDRHPELIMNGITWVVESLSIENHVEKIPGSKGIMLGKCLSTCTLCDKDTGNKYYGIFLKDGDYYTLSLEAKESLCQ